MLNVQTLSGCVNTSEFMFSGSVRVRAVMSVYLCVCAHPVVSFILKVYMDSVTGAVG